MAIMWEWTGTQPLGDWVPQSQQIYISCIYTSLCLVFPLTLFKLVLDFCTKRENSESRETTALHRLDQVSPLTIK